MPEWFDNKVSGGDIADGSIEVKDLEPALQEIVGALVVEQSVDQNPIDGDHMAEGAITPRAIDRPGQSEIYEDFYGDAGATLPIPWVANKTGANETTDYVADAKGGQYQLALDGTNEAQAAQITCGDNLLIDLSSKPVFEFRLRIDGNADMTSVEFAYIGFVANHTNAEDVFDNIDDSCWFIVIGTDVEIESDDGTTDNGGTSSIIFVDDTWTRFRIDCTDLANIGMYVDDVEQDAFGVLDMSGSAGALVQPIVALYRFDAGQAEVGFQLEIDDIRITQKR